MQFLKSEHSIRFISQHIFTKPSLFPFFFSFWYTFYILENKKNKKTF